MSNFADTFETPVKVHANGHGELSVPRLTTRHYLAWLDELTSAQREREKGNIPANVKPVDRFNILRNIESVEVTPNDLSSIVFTARGTLRVLDIALEQAGITDKAEREKIIDARSPKDNEMLAARVSGLLSAERLVYLYGDAILREQKPEAEKPVDLANPSAGGVPAPTASE